MGEEKRTRLTPARIESFTCKQGQSFLWDSKIPDWQSVPTLAVKKPLSSRDAWAKKPRAYPSPLSERSP